MKWLLTIALILSSIIQYPAKVTGQTQQTATPQQPAQPINKPTAPQKPPSQPVFQLPKTPRRLSPVSGRRAGMGSRDNCPAVTTALTALVPLQAEQTLDKQANKSAIGIVEGLTTSERPTFWFYVPYTQDLADSSAEFILQDSEGMDVYQSAIALPQKPGVMGVSLPENVKPLEVGKTYRWYFKIRCKQQRASVPIYVEGDIQRINLDSRVSQQLAAITDPQEKIAIYAQEGIWFNAITMLAELRRANNNDPSIQQNWQILLQSIGLEHIAKVQIVN